MRFTVCRGRKKVPEGYKELSFICLRPDGAFEAPSTGGDYVQELLGHADVSTTMNIYAHATREAKRTSARLLDKVIGGE